MRLPRRGLVLCLLLGARTLSAQTASREYRPQLFVTSPAWHGIALTIMTEQRMAMGNLMPTERSQGVGIGSPSYEHGSAAFEVRQVRNAGAIIEHRYSPSITLTGGIGAGLLLRNRVRLEMRDIAGTWSRRYQNRATLERRASVHGTMVTPFVFHDISYDTRFSVWNRRQGGIGARVAASRGLTVEPFWMEQTDTRKTDGTVRAIGLNLRVSL